MRHFYGLSLCLLWFHFVAILFPVLVSIDMSYPRVCLYHASCLCSVLLSCDCLPSWIVSSLSYLVFLFLPLFKFKCSLLSLSVYSFIESAVVLSFPLSQCHFYVLSFLSPAFVFLVFFNAPWWKTSWIDSGCDLHLPWHTVNLLLV